MRGERKGGRSKERGKRGERWTGKYIVKELYENDNTGKENEKKEENEVEKRE